MLDEIALRDEIVINLHIFQATMEDLKYSFLALFTSKITLNSFH